AAEPPIVLIHGFTYFVRSATFFAFTWSTSWPPPQFWKTSGGLFDCSAIGTFVVNCSFWSGIALTVTFGCSLWKSFWTFVQSFRPSPCVALCHQTSVTAFCAFAFLWVALPPGAAIAVTVTARATSESSDQNLILFIGWLLSCRCAPAGKRWSSRQPSASS